MTEAQETAEHPQTAPAQSMLGLNAAYGGYKIETLRHTPGPWRARSRNSLAKPDDDEIGGLGWEIEGPPEATLRGQFRRAADARLIAAAPEMIEALITTLPHIHEGIAREAVINAILKATRTPDTEADPALEDK